MPPKKLSISRIRAESRVRSDDPDLNRSSSRRTNASASRSRPSQRYRSVASSSPSSSSTSARGARSNANITKRSRRPPQPKTSARILHILDDDIEETRIQNLFAPDSRTQRQNVSYRPLTLTQQARRDGAAFRIPSLGSMCCSVVASCFDALLPSREQFDAAAGTNASSSKTFRNSHTSNQSPTTRKRSRARAFGAAPDSDEDQQDYVPSDDDGSGPKTSSRSRRSRRDTSATKPTASGSSQLLAGWTTSELHYLTRKTSEQLRLLSPAASFLLFKALVEQAPQHLSKHVVSTYFLPPILNPSSSGTANTAARTHVWLPASIPLLSHDKAAASNLVSHLTSALSSARQHRPSVLSQATAEEMPLAALPSRLVLTQPASFALRSLQLHGLTRLQDVTIARFFEAAMASASSSSSATTDAILRLETISLRGCIAVSDRTVTAICRSTGSTLRYLNLDFTDVSADSVAMIMMLAPNLETLKLGYNDNLSDKTLQVALQAPYSGSLPFSKLTNLRLRRCSQVGDVGVACFLKYAYKTLEVLDISGTSVGGTNPHNPDFNILLMSFFPSGLPESPLSEASGRINQSYLPLRKLNLLDTNLDYDSLIKIVERAPNMDTLLLRQMPSRTTHDGMIRLLEKLTASSQAAHWQSRPWKRLHLRILDVGDEFANLFPRLLAIFPRLHVDSLKSSQSQTSFFYDVPDRLEPSTTIVQHLKLPDARLSEHAWQFLPLITSLHTLDLSNTAVPESIVASTIEANPFLELIDLSHCKQMRISTRRNAFSLVSSESSE
ncbi:uncharacterized protein UTRI_03608_B [Ustilago trichophora]|uniref:Uncharacterized protein n=1 Tax=Ustilago trichophora TaxID=86804 RepID=A0A5C3E334_9BASI|nr:uncharacterized protein UTRI_03608_B [Ustilago trichophora]